VTGSDGDQEPEDVGVVESSSFYLASFTMVKLKHPTGKKKHFLIGGVLRK